MQKKSGIFAVLLVIAVLALVPAVSAVTITNYTGEPIYSSYVGTANGKDALIQDTEDGHMINTAESFCISGGADSDWNVLAGSYPAYDMLGYTTGNTYVCVEEGAPTTTTTTSPTTTTSTATPTPTTTPNTSYEYRKYWCASTQSSSILSVTVPGVYHITSVGGGASGTKGFSIIGGGGSGEIKDELYLVRAGDSIVANPGSGGLPPWNGGTFLDLPGNNGQDTVWSVHRNESIIYTSTAMGGVGGGNSNTAGKNVNGSSRLPSGADGWYSNAYADILPSYAATQPIWDLDVYGDTTYTPVQWGDINDATSWLAPASLGWDEEHFLSDEELALIAATPGMTIQTYCEELGYPGSFSDGICMDIYPGGNGYGSGAHSGNKWSGDFSNCNNCEDLEGITFCGGAGAGGLVFVEYTTATDYFYVQVLDSQTGEIIGNTTAVVTLSGTTESISGYGSFLFDEIGSLPISSGPYSVSASAAGYASSTATSLYYTSSGQVFAIYLTPTTSSRTYSITVTPSSFAFGSTGQASISGADLSKITAVRWYAYYPGQSIPADFYDNSSTPSSQKHLNYALQNGSWMGWDTGIGRFSNNVGSTLPNPVTLIPRYAGNILVGCYIFTSEDTYQNPTTTITVGAGQGLQSITFLAEDALSGALISPTEFQTHNLVTDTWNNQSEVRSGQIDVQYPTGTTLEVFAIPPTGSGYSIGTLTYQVYDTTGYIQAQKIPLWKNSSTNLSLTTANLLVRKNADYAAISGASIVLSDGQSCSTSSAGACQFALENGTTTYTATVSATGYTTNKFYFLPTGASYSHAFMLVAIGANPTPYITVPIGGVTTTVPSGIVTLSSSARSDNVEGSMDIWYSGAIGLSALIFLAVISTVADKTGFRRKKK